MTETNDRRRTVAKLAAATALVAAGIAGGGILASNLTASAAETTSASSTAPSPGATTGTSTSTSTSSTDTNGTTGAKPDAKPDVTAPALPAHGTAAHEDAEKAVTGTDAAKAKAAAVKSLGGGTAGDVTTDFTGQGFEVTVTKADGTQVEVHLDSSFTVQQGPGGQHGPGAPAGDGAGRGAPPAGATGQTPPAA